MKNKKLKLLIFIIRSILPMSRWSIQKDNRLIMQVLHAQTELVMLNRTDILNMKKSGPHICSKQPKPETNQSGDMYG